MRRRTRTARRPSGVVRDALHQRSVSAAHEQASEHALDAVGAATLRARATRARSHPGAQPRHTSIASRRTDASSSSRASSSTRRPRIRPRAAARLPALSMTPDSCEPLTQQQPRQLRARAQRRLRRATAASGGALVTEREDACRSSAGDGYYQERLADAVARGGLPTRSRPNACPRILRAAARARQPRRRCAPCPRALAQQRVRPLAADFHAERVRAYARAGRAGTTRCARDPRARRAPVSSRNSKLVEMLGRQVVHEHTGGRCGRARRRKSWSRSWRSVDVHHAAADLLRAARAGEDVLPFTITRPSRTVRGFRRRTKPTPAARRVRAARGRASAPRPARGTARQAEDRRTSRPRAALHARALEPRA